MRKLGLFEEKKKKNVYKSKPYEEMEYSGQRVQVDVKKYVPGNYLVDRAKGKRYY